ncbi:MAG: hypothetical protein KAY24_07760 [Candidatus Eisenbacteria sp.]|nr:hypothetical protein [Candidatus Eisenbacteria bacterium]
MASGNGRFLGVFFGTLAVLLVVGGGLAWAITHTGMVEVDIQAKAPGGCSVSGLRIPAALGHLALMFIPGTVFDQACEEVGRWSPLMSEACRQLSDCPDFTLVEVISSDEQVTIRKQGKNLIIDVDSDREIVHVTLPLSMVRAFAKRFEGSRSFLF